MQLTEKARKQGSLWGIEARDWLEIQERKSPALWRPVLDLAGVGAGTRMLDAGCGAGGASVMARERLAGADLRLAELEHLPFEDGQFDAVVAINSLQFAPDHAEAARELLRV